MTEFIEDRSMKIAPDATVRTEWIDIDRCALGNRTRMDFAAVERAGRKLLQAAPCQYWPPVVGFWSGERFIVSDGRHEYLAALALGNERLLVAWVEKANAPDA